MSWKRLPTFLANLPVRLMPFTEQQQKAFEATGHVQEFALKTTPKVGKVRCSSTLSSFDADLLLKYHQSWSSACCACRSHPCVANVHAGPN